MSSTRARVLSVDDDPMNLRTFRRVFGPAHEVELADSGQAALLLLARVPVDVVFADYSMPGMTGVELLREIQRHHPAVCRFLLTAHGDLPEVAAAVGSGLARAVILKPWDREEIERAIEGCAPTDPGEMLRRITARLGRP